MRLENKSNGLVKDVCVDSNETKSKQQEDDDSCPMMNQFEALLKENFSVGASDIGSDVYDSDYTNNDDEEYDDESSSCSSEESSIGSFEYFEASQRDISALPRKTKSLPSMCEADAVHSLLQSVRSMKVSTTSPPSVLNFPRAASMLEIRGTSKEAVKPSQEDDDDETLVCFYTKLVERCGLVYQTHPAKSMPSGYFAAVTDERIKSYSTDIVRAVMAGNLDLVYQLAEKGQNLMCCNRFGESMMHTACRYGRVSLVEHILSKGGTLRCCDDYGRTPLHDACWTATPNFDMVQAILAYEPDLMVVTDVRGSVPLDYIPKANWRLWKDFISDNCDLVLPKELLNRAE